METPATQHLDEIASGYEIAGEKAQRVPTPDDVLAVLDRYIAPANLWRVQAALERLYANER
jgi:hypothetical protein